MVVNPPEWLHCAMPVVQEYRRCSGQLHILQERRWIEWVNVNDIGVIPEDRGLGGYTLLYAELGMTVHTFGFRNIEVIQGTGSISRASRIWKPSE